MAAIWGGFIQILQLGIFSLVHFYGGRLGPAIVSFSLLARLAMMPLTLKIALRSRAHARRLRELQPELLAVRERWKDDASRLARETMAVYEKRGAPPIDGSLLKGSLVQTPLFLGLFHAIRGVLAGGAARQSFLWIGNLARPDFLLALLVAALVGLGAFAGGSGGQNQSQAILLLPALVTFLMLLKFSAGFGLYMGASATVSVLQGLLVRRREAPPL